MREMRVQSARLLADALLGHCDRVQEYYGGLCRRGSVRPEWGRGEAEVYRPAEGVTLLLFSGKLAEDAALGFSVTTEELFAFCAMEGCAALSCAGGARAALTEKTVAYSPLDRTEPVDCRFEIPGGKEISYAAVCMEHCAWTRYFGESVRFLRDAADGERRSLPLRAGAVPEIYSMFFEMCSIHMSNAESQRILLCSDAMKIAAHIFEIELEADKNSIRPEELESILITNIPNRMMRDAVNPPTAAELAREIGISETKLKKGFKAVYGVPIYAMFKQMKLEAARAALSATDCSIGEVAFQCGYQSQSQFCDAFKRRYGLTPSQFRAENARGEAFPDSLPERGGQPENPYPSMT